MKKKYKYNKAADAYLNDFYKLLGSKTWQQKYNALELALGVVPGTQSYSHNPSWEQKVGMMEYELLEIHGLIRITYV